MSSNESKSFPINSENDDCGKLRFIHFHLCGNWKIQGIYSCKK